jgi:PAS domain S-box-containing protein
MNEEPSTPPQDKSEEIFALVRRMQETEQRLQELTGGELDVVLFPTGTSFLLRKTQEDLLRSEAVQRRLADTQSSILNALPANIALIDGAGKIISVNDGWRQFAGDNALQDDACGVGQNYLEICEQAQNDHSEEAHKVAAAIRSVLSGAKKNFDMEYPCHSPGKQRWFRLLVAPLHETRASGAVVMHLDITERKRMEAAIRATELRHRSLIENMLEGYCYCRVLYDENGRAADYIYLEVNDAFAAQTGLKDVAGKKVSEVVPGMHEANPEQLEIYSRVAATGQPEKLETYAKLLDIWFSVSIYSHEKGHFIAVFDNITQRKRAEESLAATSALLETLLENTTDHIYFKDLQSRFVHFSFEMLKLFRLKHPAELKGRTDFDFFTEEHARPAFAVEQEIIRTGRPVLNLEEKTTHLNDGRTEWVLTSKMPWRDKAGNIIGTIGISRDITEQKRFELRFRRLVDSNAQAVFFWNVKGEITDCNEAFLKLVGYTCEDLKAGRVNWSVMSPPEYAELDQRGLKEVKDTGICQPYEKEFIRKDGSRVPILIGAATFEDNRDEGVAFVLDLTERRKLEQQFRQIQKMESIGQLAGGVAHDFNNVLAVIQMQAGALRLEEGISAAQREISLEIENAAQRAANITRQLLTFSRRQTVQLTELEMNEAIANMTRLLRRVIGEQVEMQFKFSMEPLFVHADAGMMDQVLMNLVVNARDAMPGGGRLIIETKGVQFGETVRDLSPQARAGSFVCIGVSDTGTGIPPEILPKIFEPFFTTKEVGKGTGLGLATVFGIVQQHQGWINVYSEAGKGTTFRVYLPRLGRKSDQKFVAETLDAGPGGKETILLVEDESHLRVSIKNILSRLGYNVLDAANGAEALEIWKKNRDKIDLVLTDMVMPGGISGRELGERLLKEDAGLKIIYASGYNTEIADRDFQLKLKEGVNYLSKPFDVQKLAKTVRDKLDEATS